MEDVSGYPNLFAALLEDEANTWTREDLGKLASGNIRRVLTHAEKVRDALSFEEPYQEWIAPEAFRASETGCMSEIE